MKSLLKLRDELRDNPLGLDYSTDETAVTSINTRDRTFYSKVSSALLLLWGGQNSVIYNVKRASQNQVDRSGAEITDTDVLSAAMVAESLIVRQDLYYDHNDVGHAALLNALVAGNVIEQSDKDRLVSTATYTGSRAEELEIVNMGEDVYLGHVIQARKLIA